MRPSIWGGRPTALFLSCLLLFGLILLSAINGCVDDVENLDESGSATHPTAGLYIPGNLLGASDPTDTPNPAAGLGERCKPLPQHVDGGMPSMGSLAISYTTQTVEGFFAPVHCTAVWIETAEGVYVATLEVKASMREYALVYFLDHACPEKPGPDVITGASVPDHTKTHTLEWTAVDFDELPVPDGPYKLSIEITETDFEPGDLYEFYFDKTATAFERELGVDGALSTLTLTWNPDGPGSTTDAAGN